MSVFGEGEVIRGEDMGANPPSGEFSSHKFSPAKFP